MNLLRGLAGKFFKFIGRQASSNTKKIYAVMVNGKLFERKDLDELLNEVKELVAK